jgi:hypothetical protein
MLFNIRMAFVYLFSSLMQSFSYMVKNNLGVVGVTAPAILSAQSQKVGWDSELRMKSLLESIYTDLKGLYNTEKKSIPNGIYMEIQDSAISDSHAAVITMLMKLRTAGIMGNTVAIGNEELPTTKAATIYRNNCRKVVAQPGYGARELDARHLKLYQEHVNNLSDWNREEEDLEIHQALLETYGETLRHGDTATACVPNWNANMFIAGLDLFDANQPVYSSNPATYSARIVAGILASGGGSLAPIVNQTLNQPVLSNLSNFALNRRITPLRIPGLPGGKGYVLTISEIQAMYLGDPVWSARNLGSLYVQYNQLKEEVQNWTGVLGAYKDLLIVQDVRQSTVLPAGSSAPYSLTAGYMWHGDTDLRNRTSTNVRDVAMLHGAGAVWKWYPQKIHFIDQKDDYGAIEGIGTACVRGIGSLVLDQQVPGVGTQEQFSSVCCLCSMPDYV